MVLHISFQMPLFQRVTDEIDEDDNDYCYQCVDYRSFFCMN